MEFFTEQNSLTFIQWVLRAVVAFFFLIIVTKIMGQRSISQLRLIDFTMAILIGNIIAHPLSDEQLGLKGAMTTMSVLVLLYTISLYLNLKWTAVKKFLEPAPFPVIEKGQIIYKGLKKARITLDVLLSELRKQKVEDIQKVALALWEPGGSLSVFLKPQYNPVTPKQIKIGVTSFSVPIPVVKEGKIDAALLQQIGKDALWLENKIKTMFSLELENVLLATIDSNEKIKVLTYK